MYNGCSENKGADYLHLCFHIGKNLVFPCCHVSSSITLLPLYNAWFRLSTCEEVIHFNMTERLGTWTLGIGIQLN